MPDHLIIPLPVLKLHLHLVAHWHSVYKPRFTVGSLALNIHLFTFNLSTYSMCFTLGDYFHRSSLIAHLVGRSTDRLSIPLVMTVWHTAHSYPDSLNQPVLVAPGTRHNLLNTAVRVFYSSFLYISFVLAQCRLTGLMKHLCEMLQLTILARKTSLARNTLQTDLAKINLWITSTKQRTLSRKEIEKLILDGKICREDWFAISVDYIHTTSFF